jgi:anti-anti-sigma factor
VDTGRQISIRDETAPGGPAVLAVTGELDVQSSAELRDAVDSRGPAASTGLIVDLSDVPFLDSSAVGTLLEMAARARSGGAGFAVVVGALTQSRSRLDLTGTSRVLNVCHDRDEALELLGAGGGRASAETPRDGGGGHGEPPRVVTLTIFLNATSAHAPRARAAADELRRRLPPGAILEQVDVAERPDLAERHRVLATPMLIRSGPRHRRVVGDLSNLDEVLLALDLPLEAP